MKLLTSSTQIALWQEIVHDAEVNCATPLKEDIESYLVFMLMRYLTKPDFVKQVMASEFLNGLNASWHQRGAALQEVGDKCLIFSGLFPNLAEKRLVKIGYFVTLGQAAYEAISQKHNDLYNSLAHSFVSLMDVLQAIRCYSHDYPDLLPLQAYDLWNETGSQRALSVLGQYTRSIPVKSKK